MPISYAYERICKYIQYNIVRSNRYQIRDQIFSCLDMYVVDPACDVAVYVSPCSLLSVNGDVVASTDVSATLRMSETSP